MADGLCHVDKHVQMAEADVPSATPVPRGPSTLLLGSAADLLTRAGCPVCRYAAESAEAYLAWFALEGHHDTDVLSRVVAARGMCPSHTRRLLTQPGASSRLAAVFRYVIEAAMRDPFARPAPCPACEHDAAAEDRVLEALLDQVEGGDRQAYKRHGGLCLPHLRRAANVHRKVDLRWLTRFMIFRLGDQAPDIELIAGLGDPDAGARALLRNVLETQRPGAGSATCSACWAAANAERSAIAESMRASRGAAARPEECLCTTHLRDCALLGAADPEFLACQAECQAARLHAVVVTKPRLLGISASWLSTRARRALGDPDCRVCRSRDEAAMEEIAQIGAAVRAIEPSTRVQLTVCVQHARRLHDLDAAVGRMVWKSVATEGDQLLRELEAAFAKETWAHRGEARGAEMTAWRRAATFLDGAVRGGCRDEAYPGLDCQSSRRRF
jgi:hypothetical protein